MNARLGRLLAVLTAVVGTACGGPTLTIDRPEAGLADRGDADGDAAPACLTQACQGCGRPGEACCGGSACNPGSSCAEGRCVACGQQAGDSCCVPPVGAPAGLRGVCQAAGLHCDLQSGKCQSCGCNGGACCGVGQSCQEGQCRACGGAGQSCCPDGEPAPRCGGGSSCGPDGTCRTCGAPGQPCCPENKCQGMSCCLAGQCQAPAAACSYEGKGYGMCENGKCGCGGGAGQPCCPVPPGGEDTLACNNVDMICKGGSSAAETMCVRCGRLGDPCCASKRCAQAGVACLGVRGQGFACRKCGAQGEPCCVGATAGPLCEERLRCVEGAEDNRCVP
jgi:hypothetical protein